MKHVKTESTTSYEVALLALMFLILWVITVMIVVTLYVGFMTSR